MEIFAAYSENADWNVGRLLDAIHELGDLDNTLVLYIWGDNGASMEGTPTGSFNEMTFLNGLVLDADQQLALIEQYGGIEALGGEHSAPHYAAAWGARREHAVPVGQADRQVTSGGTRNPMVIAWPNRIEARGDLRSQFTHCIDIGPTILEAAGIPEPKTVDGIEQEPMDGTSFLYTFEDPNAAERHTRAVLRGCSAVAPCTRTAGGRRRNPGRFPWDVSLATLGRYGPGSEYDPDATPRWELYYLPDDFAQAQEPRRGESRTRCRELQELWWAEAERNHVLPLYGGLP